jgi:glyoxylase-like metal-dependent hydrolase (beta-lactamase superfamily II)
MTQKICENVCLVGSSSLTDPGDCMVYLVKAGGKAVLIDAGTGRDTEAMLANVQAAGVEPETLSAIILTHCHVDHIGGANEIRERTGAKVHAHKGDAQAIEQAIPRFTVERYYGMKLGPIPVDVRVSGESGEFDFAQDELSWVHTPGHTPGSMAVVYGNPAGGKVLFGQDIHGPFEPGYDSNMEDWRESMKRLLALEADILCEGHFGVFEPAAEVRRFIEGYLRRHAQARGLH